MKHFNVQVKFMNNNNHKTAMETKPNTEKLIYPCIQHRKEKKRSVCNIFKKKCIHYLRLLFTIHLIWLLLTQYEDIYCFDTFISMKVHTHAADTSGQTTTNTFRHFWLLSGILSLRSSHARPPCFAAPNLREHCLRCSIYHRQMETLLFWLHYHIPFLLGQWVKGDRKRDKKETEIKWVRTRER